VWVPARGLAAGYSLGMAVKAGKNTVYVRDDDVARISRSGLSIMGLARESLDLRDRLTTALTPAGDGCRHPKNMRDTKNGSRCRCGAIGLDPK
jgi:hypothetical protein